jgi:putative transposase
MRQIDQLYLQSPFYGSRRLTANLKREGYVVNRKRVQRLMRQMGIQAIYPRKKLSVKHPDHRIFPYLLRGVKIERVNHVWSSDITYIPMRRGFLYLVAIMDWFSRYVLSWMLSQTLEKHFCVQALEKALSVGEPEIFNSDQGSQFTSPSFTGILQSRGISISMDGRGRVFDNIFIERLWRTVKQEEVYLKDYQSMVEAEEELTRYFEFYNTDRLHQSLGYRSPLEIFRQEERSK